jgi:hypothetical protein
MEAFVLPLDFGHAHAPLHAMTVITTDCLPPTYCNIPTCQVNQIRNTTLFGSLYMRTIAICGGDTQVSASGVGSVAFQHTYVVIVVVVVVSWSSGPMALPIAFTFPAQSRHQHSHDGHLLLPKGCDNERTWIDRKCGRSSPYEPTVRYHTATVVVCARGVA